MHGKHPYPIGTPGVPWGEQEIRRWRERCTRQREYAQDVLAALNPLLERFEIQEYGRLPIDPARYPLIGLRARDWDDARPVALVSGGVHGYETSGVLGALRFAQRDAADYVGRVNLLIAPCVSPWSWEHVQRWNPDAVDPNRSFVNRAAHESAALADWLAPLRERIALHIDLHETTDTDESEFRPALAARDGKDFEPGEIPDGFYLVDDTAAPAPAFQNAIIAAVAELTHIAAPDARGQIIGSDMVAPGVIRYPLRELGLCAGLSEARFRTTTEVYPDSPRTDPETCIEAQCRAIRAALDFLLHSDD